MKSSQQGQQNLHKFHKFHTNEIINCLTNKSNLLQISIKKQIMDNIDDYIMEENLSSTIDPDTFYTPYSQRLETYIVPFVFFIIFVVGVLGNGTLVVIFLRHRAMRNVPNT